MEMKRLSIYASDSKDFERTPIVSTEGDVDMEEWEILDEEAFEQFRESGGSLFDLADFTFDYQDELDALAEVDFTPSDLTSNSIDFSGTSADGTPYDVTFSGSGISPTDPDNLRDALANGTASGTINGMSVEAGGEEILSLDVNDNGYTLQSGAQELEFEGAFSNELNDFSGQAAGIFDIEAALGGTSTGAGLGLAGLFSFFQPSEDESGISITLRDGGDDLAGISFGGDSLLTLSSGTYSIAFNGEFPDFNDLVMNPRLELRDSNGGFIDGVDGASGFASIMDYSPGSGGTYYLAVSGVEADDTGDYQLVPILTEGTSSDTPTNPVEDDDAADSTSTDYQVVPADIFSGTVDSSDDSDWVEIDLDAANTYNFTVSAVPEDFNFGLDSIVVSESGEPIARLDNIPTIQDILDGIEDLLDDLDLPIPDLTGPNGWASGDPHLQTLDGVGYDFHAVGEYVLARGTDSNFEVQARMEPVGGGSNASLISAVAARAANGDEVMIDATDADPLSVNGGAVTIADGETHDVGNDRIYRDGDTYTMVFAGDDGAINDGDSQISVAVRDERVDVNLQISEALGGNLEGLLGDGDGNPSNDIALADGPVLERPLAYEDVYGQYRDDWRVDTEGNSLFTYDTGESLADFYDASYPADMPSLSDFDDSEIAGARAAVEDGGLTPGTLEYDNAVLDYLLTDGDESYIDSARETSGGDGAPAGALEPGQGRASLNLSVEKFGSGDALDGAQAGFAPDGATAGIPAQAAGSAGGYTFSLAEGASGRVEVVREHQSGDPDINVSDALDVLRLAVELEPGWGGPAADENFVAADIDQDGAVTVSDALEVLRAAVDLESDAAPRWVGFEEGTDFSGQSRKSVDVETGVSIEALNDGDSIDMTAILLGNMEQVV